MKPPFSPSTPGPSGFVQHGGGPGPANFMHQPGQTFYDMQQQQPPVTAKPERRARNRSTAPPPPPLLTVHSDGRVQLSIPFAVAAGLGHGKPFDLIVPRQAGGAWYLETYRQANPKPGQGYTLPANPRSEYQVRTRRPIASLFRRPQPVRVGAAALITGNVNLPLASLRFLLGPEVPGYPGYYQLLPAPAGTVSRIG